MVNMVTSLKIHELRFELWQMQKCFSFTYIQIIPLKTTFLLLFSNALGATQSSMGIGYFFWR